MMDFELPERYVLQKRLGGGSYGDVYLGLDRKLDRKVAIKLMKGMLDEDSLRTAAEIFRREAKLLALLDHFHTVRIFDYDVAGNGALFLVMEFLDGRVLSDLPLPLDLELVSQFVTQIGSALQSAHDRGLIHRDLKPANVMYVEHGGADNRFVLLDLGIAKLVNAAKATSNTIRNMTFAGHGTPLYMAPEQVEEKDVDARADVYAFGSTLFELLTGSAPFGHIRGTHYNVIKAVVSEPPPRLRDAAPDSEYTRELEDLIDECLRKDADSRPASIRSVVERFHGIVTRVKHERHQAEQQLAIETEISKRTIHPSGHYQTGAETYAGGTTGPDDPYATQQGSGRISSHSSTPNQWSHQTPAPRRWLGLTSLLLLLSLPALAMIWWNWKQLPAPIVATTLPTIKEQTIPEGAEWTYLVTAALADNKPHRLTYSLGGSPPAGLRIDSQTGRMHWKPTETQGPGKYSISVEVESPDEGVQSTRQTFTIHVSEVNAPPKIDTVNQQQVAPGEELTLTVPAHDSDLPRQKLQYRLKEPPAGAEIDATTGSIVWAPLPDQLGHDTSLVVTVTDGSPQTSPPIEKRIGVTLLKYNEIAFPPSTRLKPRTFSSVENSQGMEFVLIDPNEFQMGSPSEEPDRQDDELQHPVQLTHRLLFGRHEVTVGQFAKFIADNPTYKTTAEQASPPGTTWRTAFTTQHDDFPVVNVSWHDAVAFCEWLSRTERLSYRLPTEAEWECACRAGSVTRYFWGNDEQSLGIFANVLDQSLQSLLKDPQQAAPWDDGFPNTSPVGKFQANGFGIFDLNGNAWEWCSDRYAPDFPKQLIIDPTGPEAGELHVVRGGSWLSLSRDARSATRDARPTMTYQNNIGFRVVRVP